MHFLPHSPRLCSLTTISLLLFCLLQSIAEATHIEVYSDSRCQDKLAGWNGPNTGRCSTLRRDGNFTSFMITQPDAGCAVTIYKQDTSSPCSGDAIVASPELCYNSKWFMYSIDGCVKGGSTTSSETKTETTTSTSSSTTLATHTKATQSASATAAPSHDHGPSTGTIVGGVVGGVAAGAIMAAIVIIAFIRYRRTKRAKGEGRNRGGSAPPPYGSGGGAVEVAAKEAPVRNPGTWASQAHELGHEAPVELQNNPVHELPDDSGRGELGSKSPTGTQGSGEAILGGSTKQ